MPKRTALAILLIGAVSCSREHPAEPLLSGQPALANCTLPFDSLVADIARRPGVYAGPMQGETARVYVDDARWAIYLVTTPKHPAHPAVLYRAIVPTTEGPIIGTQGCAYGNRDALNDDLRRYALLDAALRSEMECSLCDRHPSPWLEHATKEGRTVRP